VIGNSSLAGMSILFLDWKYFIIQLYLLFLFLNEINDLTKQKALSDSVWTYKRFVCNLLLKYGRYLLQVLWEASWATTMEIQTMIYDLHPSCYCQTQPQRKSTTNLAYHVIISQLSSYYLSNLYVKFLFRWFFLLYRLGRIIENVSLFTYGVGESYHDYQKLSFRPAFKPPPNVSPDVRRLCGSDEECMFDYAVTGSAELAAETQQFTVVFDNSVAASYKC
jgi:hypothetical protein